MAKEYEAADSVFGLYVKQYPDQGFGYYWQARSSALIDKDMETGKAVPHYQKLIELLGEDPENETHKKWLVDAYAYLAAFETNKEKDYAEAIDHFEKLLEIDPDNEDAKKYIGILERNLEKTESSK
jgi:tetratricopeptide (TPR) repeat protein